MQPQEDISTRSHLEALLADFYSRLLADGRVADKFDGIDLTAHLPRIVDFWHNLLHQARCYSGNPFDPHIKLNLEPKHFDVWLGHFNTTIDERHSGPIADEMKRRAKHIGSIFAWKLQSIRGESQSTEHPGSNTDQSETD